MELDFCKTDTDKSEILKEMKEFVEGYNGWDE